MASSEGLSLLNKIESEDLYTRLIDQINKDANLADLQFFVNNRVTAEELVDSLYFCVIGLITTDKDTYQNFLYRVDVSESQLQHAYHGTIEKMAENITLLILKREWQKVYFRSKNQ